MNKCCCLRLRLRHCHSWRCRRRQPWWQNHCGLRLQDLRLRALSGAALDWQGIAARIRGGVPEDAVEGLPRWTAATLVRLALIYSRRRRNAGLLDALLCSADDALGGTGEWAGIV